VTLPSHVEHLVVGAGFAGVSLAIGLQDDGEEFLVIEKADGLGGTWWANTYPGATCDIPSHLYSFSFAPNPDWSHAYSPQAEILTYLEKVAAGAGVLDRFHCGVELLAAAWDDEALRWRVRTSAGELTSTTLINATGGLSAPKLPDIEGIETFGGHLFHTARWDHDVDLKGLRVAVIGTGASAIQVVPAIQPEVGHLDVYQRSAAWVIPRGDHPFTESQRRRFRRFPALQRALRARLYYSHEALVPGITRWQRLNFPVETLGRRNLAKGVEDPVLREKLTPHFGVFCKRILTSDDYYPAMSAANVDVVTDPIARITPTGVVTADGTERPVDVIVVATGFRATDPPVSHLIRGRDGRTLAETWVEAGMTTYKGTTSHGFPNLFAVLGANTGQGHTSVIVYIEAMTGYVRDAIRTMRRGGYAAIEPLAAAQERWNADIQRRMRRTVWARGGCTSWYLDAQGRNPITWPRSTIAFRRALKRFDVDGYDVGAVQQSEQGPA
jgi:cation diffusion facilitator CzcD-associated flavoprotein CzcO